MYGKLPEEIGRIFMESYKCSCFLHKKGKNLIRVLMSNFGRC